MTIFRTGLMSVTFRAKSMEEVVELAVCARVEQISWTSDVHVPVGNLPQAELARELCQTAGLGIEAYCSYWRADEGSSGGFLDVLGTAVRLGAPRIRVWAGNRASEQCCQADRMLIAHRLAEAADLAAAHSVSLFLEFHVNTLTDTAASTKKLLEDIDSLRAEVSHPVQSYWQPRPGVDEMTALKEIRMLDGRIEAFHVFSWGADASRLPLAAYREVWLVRLRAIERSRAPKLDLLLEFVAGSDPQQLMEDALELHSWITQLDGGES